MRILKDAAPDVTAIVIIIKIGLGFTSVVVLTWISEITSTNIRQMAMVLPLSIYSVAIFIWTFALELSELNFRKFNFLSGVCALILFTCHTLVILNCPESPYYLNWMERYEETEQSLEFYTGYRHVRIAEDTPQAIDILLMNGCVQRWREKFREIFKTENLQRLGIICFLILVKWSTKQSYSELLLTKVAMNIPVSLNFVLLLPLAGFSIFLMLSINLFARRRSLLVVTIISLTVSVIMINIPVDEGSPLLAVLIFVKYSIHYIFVSVILCCAGVSFPTNIRALFIALVMSLEALIRNTFFWIGSLIEKESIWIYSYELITAKACIDIGSLVVAGVLVVIFIPKTIEVQSDGMLKNYAVASTGDLELLRL
ncbi:uncharacterized protein LOC124404412 isoform X2 [Diprion similis]|uniref:uncharacterized protein LOC124404412 isoform X2 n=1 Tax=Diprion similis TaxID=362088 RepID=UPI001EF98793|nr:uncharacterized protein LOC124404412 isoform X2 [Diprion similis]